MGWMAEREAALAAANERSDEPPVDLRQPPRMVGEPGLCPACGGSAFLDRLDLRRELQHEHCRACDHRWSTPFSELILRA